MEDNEFNEHTFVHTHIIAAFASVCVLLMAMLLG